VSHSQNRGASDLDSAVQLIAEAFSSDRTFMAGFSRRSRRCRIVLISAMRQR
jgi:hypothetical protein